MAFKTPLEMSYHWQDTNPDTVFLLRIPIVNNFISKKIRSKLGL